MKSNHEYQIMKYFPATLCQNLAFFSEESTKSYRRLTVFY